MMAEVAIQVSNLSKSFKLPTEKSGSLKQSFVNWTKGIKGYTKQQVLDDISFTVEKGDFFGIVGRNGCGKSTLLKLISGIYVPDSGNISINGSLVSFIELGVGFNHELTGKENVYLNGALLGFSASQIDAMYDEIVEFAELREFMAQKLKNYSSGMQVRLAFSCAIRAKSDILVLDEVLAVGDESFQRKCNSYFEKAAADKEQTIVLVTHNMDAVKKYCNKALLVKEGSIEACGGPETVANEYTRINYEHEKPSEERVDAPKYPVGLSAQVPDMYVELVSDTVIEGSDTLIFNVNYTITDNTSCYACFSLYCGNLSIVFDDMSKWPTTKAGVYSFRYEYDLKDLHNGEYWIACNLRRYESRKTRGLEPLGFSGEERAARFTVVNSPGSGLLARKGVWVTQAPEVS